MSLTAAPARIVPLLVIAPSGTDAVDDDIESTDMDLDAASPEPLSRAVLALIATAALALSAVCTALLLTFASTSIAPPTFSDGTSGTSGTSVLDSVHD